MFSFIKSVIFSKPGMVFLVFVALLIPLSMVEDKILERSGYHDQVVIDIGNSWTREQTLMGPLVVVGYQTVKYNKAWNKESKIYETKSVYSHKTALLPLHSLVGNIYIDTERRYRGIHEVPVYTATVEMKGEFDPSTLHGIGNISGFHKFRYAYVWLFASDQRGFLDLPELELKSESAVFIAGGYENIDSRGIKVPIDIDKLPKTDKVPMNVTFRLKGTEFFKVVPAARSNDIAISSDWAHPSFTGLYLPNSREIGDGFEARWQVTDLATNLGRDLGECVDEKCSDLLENSFGVKLIDPVDVYQISERAVKYALLFIGIVFTAFFIAEVVKGLSIHPLQYLLVGAALSIFYLLLIALSEHIAFNQAYIISTAMCSVLLGYYGRYILGSWAGGLLMLFSVTGLFGLLNVILLAEDSALLLGAMLTFLMLTVVMMVTRDRNRLANLDWSS